MFLKKLYWIVLSLSLFWVGMTGYDYYKSYFWPEATATVIAARETCLYSKGRSFNRQSKLPFCDDEEEAARLIADGFKFKKTRRLRIEAEIGTEAGQRIQTTLEPLLEAVVGVKAGSTIRVRYSPATPGSSEVALAPDGRAGLFALGVAILLGSRGYFARRRLSRHVPPLAQVSARTGADVRGTGRQPFGRRA